MTRNPALPVEEGPISVALVGDDAPVLAELTRVLGLLPGVKLVELAQADVAIAAPRTLGDPLYLRIPSVTVVGSPQQVAPALASGSRGVIARTHLAADLRATLVAVRSGLTVIDSSLATEWQAPRPAARQAEPSVLTGRERQVVDLLARGLSNKLIADRLGISDHTAKFHVNGVMMKLNASTRTGAVVEAVRRGLVTL